MPVKFDVMARTGSYQDKDGNEKSRWQKCGVVFENDKGQLSMKLEAMPVGNTWEGWFSLFVPTPYEGGQTRQAAPQRGASEESGDSPIPW